MTIFTDWSSIISATSYDSPFLPLERVPKSQGIREGTYNKFWKSVMSRFITCMSWHREAHYIFKPDISDVTIGAPKVVIFPWHKFVWSLMLIPWNLDFHLQERQDPPRSLRIEIDSLNRCSLFTPLCKFPRIYPRIMHYRRGMSIFIADSVLKEKGENAKWLKKRNQIKE